MAGHALTVSTALRALAGREPRALNVASSLSVRHHHARTEHHVMMVVSRSRVIALGISMVRLANTRTSVLLLHVETVGLAVTMSRLLVASIASALLESQD